MAASAFAAAKVHDSSPGLTQDIPVPVRIRSALVQKPGPGPSVGFFFATVTQSNRPEHGEVFTHTFQPRPSSDCANTTPLSRRNDRFITKSIKNKTRFFVVTIEPSLDGF